MKNVLIALSLLVALTACSDDKKPAPASTEVKAGSGTVGDTKVVGAVTTVTDGKGNTTTKVDVAAAAMDPKAEAEQIFQQRCVLCHGTEGKGDGVGAASLNPKPRAYADAAWQKSVTDDYLAKVILEGGAAVGKSPLMVANPDLKDKPEVLKGLVAKVRSFAPKG